MKSEHNDPIGPFDLNNFKKWMKKQDADRPKSSLLGVQVESKISTKDLLDEIEIHEGKITTVAKDFKKNGGIITDVDGNNILIEVDSGLFFIHRMHCKKS